eukprot:1094737-Amorphochlora_amoeboformis.AAC.2
MEPTCPVQQLRSGTLSTCSPPFPCPPFLALAVRQITQIFTFLLDPSGWGRGENQNASPSALDRANELAQRNSHTIYDVETCRDDHDPKVGLGHGALCVEGRRHWWGNVRDPGRSLGFSEIYQYPLEPGGSPDTTGK